MANLVDRGRKSEVQPHDPVISGRSSKRSSGLNAVVEVRFGALDAGKWACQTGFAFEPNFWDRRTRIPNAFDLEWTAPKQRASAGPALAPGRALLPTLHQMRGAVRLLYVATREVD